MDMRRGILIGLLLSFLSASCGTDRAATKEIILPDAMQDDHFNVFIETSAGEHLMRSFQDSTGSLDSVTLLSFLPLPVNLGFIPTYARPDSQLVKTVAWVFSYRVESGEALPTRPLGMLNFIEDGEEKNHFVMIPTNEHLRIMEATSFDDFAIRYDAIKYSFEYWLRNRGGVGRISRLRWRDEKTAHEQLVEQINISEE